MAKEEPYLTARFYPDGHTETTTGPARFPIDPDDVQKCLGGVLLLLWQVAQMGNSRMVALHLHRLRMDEILQSLDDKGEN